MSDTPEQLAEKVRRYGWDNRRVNPKAEAALDVLLARLAEAEAEQKRIIKDSGLVITRTRKRAETAEAQAQDLGQALDRMTIELAEAEKDHHDSTLRAAHINADLRSRAEAAEDAIRDFLDGASLDVLHDALNPEQKL